MGAYAIIRERKTPPHALSYDFHRRLVSTASSEIYQWLDRSCKVSLSMMDGDRFCGVKDEIASPY